MAAKSQGIALVKEQIRPRILHDEVDLFAAQTLDLNTATWGAGLHP
jgi:hypothetical protein